MDGAIPASRTVRCAIYTRKSTEEGLEQAFNSLDAQREACAAYILSQRHERWMLLPDYYDDGGFSGGNMARPGLRQLMADVAAGKVDVIVVYKIDRLTRSLSDFAKIVEVLDGAGASFVSITQAFNTTTSMGRLTLNVLLSFAQFEREVTGERIRDKIAASKKKGMWMGGVVPLGYEVNNRKLVVVEAEANTVRRMFERYLALGSVAALKTELDAQGVHSRQRISRNGRSYGGVGFTMGALYVLLQNRIYLGEICHGQASYPGEQQSIVSRLLFEEVQAELERNRVARQIGENADQPSLLAGMLYDGHGRRMSPSHAAKRAKRYRYYVSRRDSPQDKELPAWRIPAADIEEIVIGRLVSYLRDGDAVRQDLPHDIEALQLAGNFDRAASLVDRLRHGAQSEQKAVLLKLVERIDVVAAQILIAVRAGALCERHVSSTPLVARAAIVRVGQQVRFAIAGSEAVQPVHRDPALIKLVAKAHRARTLAVASAVGSIDEVASEQELTRNYLTRLLRLSYLAPDIITAILDGRQPATLTRQRLARIADLPLDWPGQRRLLGMGT